MGLDKLRFISRKSQPSKLDTADYKTICKVTMSDFDTEFYIQLSRDSEHPNWGKLGTFDDEEMLLRIVDLIE